jgi:hypothetical protein
MRVSDEHRLAYHSIAEPPPSLGSGMAGKEPQRRLHFAVGGYPNPTRAGEVSASLAVARGGSRCESITVALALSMR